MIGFKVWLFLILFVLAVSAADDDPCDDANHVILDDIWRSTSYDTSVGGTIHCDVAIEERWYKPEGADMPTSAPDLYTCGTDNPVWMDDILPASTSITDVKVCMRTTFTKCQYTWNIRVKKCNTFYVYELQQTSLCNSAYCFGDKIKCPAGQNSDTGDQPGCGEYPNVTLTAEVTHGQYEGSLLFFETPTILKGILFQCDISSDEDLTDYVYDIQWFINDNSIVTHRNIPFTNLTQTGLHQSEWTDTYILGFLVKCAVRVRNDIDNPPTLYTNSEYFHAGIETDSFEYTVPENGHINITVRLTIPIDCRYPSDFTPEKIQTYISSSCKVDIRLSVPKESDVSCTPGGVTNEPVSFDGTKCGITFDYDEWNTPKTLTVYGSADGIVEMSISKTAYLRLETDDSVGIVAWLHASMPDIKIHVLDEDISGKSCTFQTDPHLNTFDGKPLLFPLEGEFIIYKHETLPIRIHAVFDECWQTDRGVCTCGVAIRYMDAVFVLNFCKEKIGEPWLYASNVNRYVEMRACDDSSMTIKYTHGGTYKVTLPSGTVITMQLHLGLLNTHIFLLTITPSLVDWRATSGMCGFLDGVKDNDFRDREGNTVDGFGRIWQLNHTLDGPSLFTSNPVLVDIPLPSLQYCKCPVPDDNRPGLVSLTHCNLTSPAEVCDVRSDFNSYVTQCDKYRPNSREKRDTLGYLQRRHGRSTDEDIEVPRFDLDLNDTYVNSPEKIITWINGWNESLAEEACRNTMDNDPMLIKCKDAVAAMNDITANGINECILDIKISGHAGFLEDTKKALQTTCQIEAERFENLTTRANGTSTSFLEELMELSCPDNCSGKGICINGFWRFSNETDVDRGTCTNTGTCACYADFYGESCTMKINIAPEIFSGGITCSTDQKACKTFVISGINFLDITLTCLVRPIKVYHDRWEIGGSQQSFPARYLNDFSCVCAIPDSTRRRRSTNNEQVYAEGYLLSISNDGINYSNETTILAYDSTCYDCDPTNLNCTQLSESCQSTTTPPTVITKSTSKDKDMSLGAILGGIFGGLAAIFVFHILILIIITKCKSHNDNRVEDKYKRPPTVLSATNDDIVLMDLE